MLQIAGFPGLGRLNAITLGIHVVFCFLSLHKIKVYGIMFIHIMKYLHQQIATSINGPLSEIAPIYSLPASSATGDTVLTFVLMVFIAIGPCAGHFLQLPLCAI